MTCKSKSKAFLKILQEIGHFVGFFNTLGCAYMYSSRKPLLMVLGGFELLQLLAMGCQNFVCERENSHLSTVEPGQAQKWHARYSLSTCCLPRDFRDGGAHATSFDTHSKSETTAAKQGDVELCNTLCLFPCKKSKSELLETGFYTCSLVLKFDSV